MPCRLLQIFIGPCTFFQSTFSFEIDVVFSIAHVISLYFSSLVSLAFGYAITSHSFRILLKFKCVIFCSSNYSDCHEGAQRAEDTLHHSSLLARWKVYALPYWSIGLSLIGKMEERGFKFSFFFFPYCRTHEIFVLWNCQLWRLGSRWTDCGRLLEEASGW